MSDGQPSTLIRRPAFVRILTLHIYRVTFRALRDGSLSASFRIPWTKTTREEGTSVVLTGRKDVLCPCEALRAHLLKSHNIPTSTSLFAYQTPDGDWEHMLKHKFMSFCMGIWEKAGLAHVQGHSFRIGGAVELLLAGVPPEIVAATGGWTSLAFLLYWRRMEEILPMSTSKAYRQSQITELAKVFEAFRVANNIPSNLLSVSEDSRSLSINPF
jgi:Phage integrase family